MTKGNNNCAASEEFSMSEKQVHQWHAIPKQFLEEIPTTKKSYQLGHVSFPELKKVLSIRVLECG